MRQAVVVALLCMSLTGCVSSSDVPTSIVVAPVAAESGGWVPLSMLLRAFSNTSDVAGVRPIATWKHRRTQEQTERVLTTVWVQAEPDQGFVRPILRLARVPRDVGAYDLTLAFKSVGGTWSRAVSGTVYVMPFLLYLVIIGVFLPLLMWGSAVGLTHPRRLVKTAVVIALIMTMWWWLPLLLGGHTLFFAAIALAVWHARRQSDHYRLMITTSLGGMCFLELYWGALLSGSYFTAPVISLSIIGLLYLILRAVLRTNRRVAVGMWVLFLMQAGLYLCMTIYKAFFLDYPVLAAGGDIGQVARIADSIAHVIRVTHLLTIASPFIVLAVWWRARRKILLADGD